MTFFDTYKNSVHARDEVKPGGEYTSYDSLEKRDKDTEEVKNLKDQLIKDFLAWIQVGDGVPVPAGTVMTCQAIDHGSGTRFGAVYGIGDELAVAFVIRHLPKAPRTRAYVLMGKPADLQASTKKHHIKGDWKESFIAHVDLGSASKSLVPTIYPSRDTRVWAKVGAFGGTDSGSLSVAYTPPDRGGRYSAIGTIVCSYTPAAPVTMFTLTQQP